MKDIDEIRRDNLKRIESDLGGPTEAAKAIGMSVAQFTNLRDGAKDSKTGKPRGMRKETARRIEAAAQKPPGWLDTIHGVDEAQRFESNISEIDSRAKVPVISWVQAGELSEVFDIFHPGEAVQWEDALYSRPSRHAYALVVEGDSMDRPGATPNFPAGTVLIVDPERASLAGDYVIAKDVATQRATFKQLATDGARWYLKPLNTAYPTLEIDDPALRVIGRVIEFRPPGGKL